MSYSTKIVHRVYNHTQGIFIEVGPNPDSPDLVEIRTSDKKSSDYFGGQINFSLDPAAARLFAQAVVACAIDAEALRLKKKNG